MDSSKLANEMHRRVEKHMPTETDLGTRETIFRAALAGMGITGEIEIMAILREFPSTYLTNRNGRGGAAEWAKTWIDQIEHDIAYGISSVYADVRERLYDLYPDLPWSNPDADAVALLVRSDSRWETVKAQFLARFGVELEDPQTRGRRRERLG